MDKELVVVFLSMFAIGFIMVGAAILGSERTCIKQWQDYDPKYSIVTGCQIQVDGKWTPTENYRIAN